MSDVTYGNNLQDTALCVCVPVFFGNIISNLSGYVFLWKHVEN